MASVPYTAEAPSRNTSTRSSAAKGIEFKSTARPFKPWVATRRPFSSTRVASAPWPRRLAPDTPLLPRCSSDTIPPLLARLSDELPAMFICNNNCSAEVIPAASISALLNTVIGKAPSSAVLLMLEPVTRIRSTLASESEVSDCTGLSCAKACVLRPARVRA